MAPQQKKRMALLIPHTDTTLEADLQDSSLSYSVHTERMWLDDVTRAGEEKMIMQEMPRALSYLAPVSPDVAVFGCTSASALHGLNGERALVKEISRSLNCPSITAFGAVIDALKLLEPARVALITPYITEVTEKVAFSLIEAGLKVNYWEGMGEASDEAIGRKDPLEIIHYVTKRRSCLKESDCLLLSCTNLRALACREDLERFLDLPVVTSNNAIIAMLSRYHKEKARDIQGGEQML